MPWAEGKHPVTRTYAWFLANWAKRLSWKEVAEVFQSSWDVVFGAVEMAVAYGREHLHFSEIQSLGIDEIAGGRGHRYLTVVYQIDAHCKRLLWVGEKRTVKTLLTFFHWLGAEPSAALRFICSDMWKPYLKVIAKKAGRPFILDCFHIWGTSARPSMRSVPRKPREIKARGQEPVLTKTRWLLLKRPQNLTEKQEVRLADLLRDNLRSVRSYLLKGDFQFFWGYRSPYWAGCFLDRWCTRTMRSKIGPMKRVARMLRGHRPLILNWFRAKGQPSSGVVEGFNAKAKLTTRKAYGFRTYHGLKSPYIIRLAPYPSPS